MSTNKEFYASEFLTKTFEFNTATILSALAPTIALRVGGDADVYAGRLKDYLRLYGNYIINIDDRDLVVALNGAKRLTEVAE